MEVTLRTLRQHHACISGYNKLVAHVFGPDIISLHREYAEVPEDWHDRPIPMLTVLKAVGFDDTMWATRALDGKCDRDLFMMTREFCLLTRDLVVLRTQETDLKVFDAALELVLSRANGKDDPDLRFELRNKLKEICGDYTGDMGGDYLARAFEGAREALCLRASNAVWHAPDWVDSTGDREVKLAKMNDIAVQTFTNQSWWQK